MRKSKEIIRALDGSCPSPEAGTATATSTLVATAPEKPKFCTPRLHYIGKTDKVCACGQLVTVEELDRFALKVQQSGGA